MQASAAAAAAAPGEVCAVDISAAVAVAFATPLVAVYRFALPLVNFLQRLAQQRQGAKINWKLISCFDYRLCRTFYDLEYDTFVSSPTSSRPVLCCLCPPVALLWPRGCVHFLTKLARQWHELKRIDQPYTRIATGSNPPIHLSSWLCCFNLSNTTAHSFSPPVRWSSGA